MSSSLSHRRESQNSFSGSDWQTIVYTDFEGPYTREKMYYALPDPDEIADYFANLATIASTSAPLREAAAHRHTVAVPGLPAALAGAGWQLDNLRGQAYREVPSLAVTHTERGLDFTLTGYTASSIFQGLTNTDQVAVSYDLVLPSRGNLPALRIPVNQRMGTSAHPLVDLAGSRFELRRRNSGQYAFQWHLTVQVEDRENPLDPNGRFQAEKITVGLPGDTLDARVVSATYDARRTTLTVVLESERSWPLKMIDDRNMRTFPLQTELCLPVKDGYSVCRRPVTARLAVPRIVVAPATPQIPTLSPPSGGPVRG
jgi:hypothetical protein